MYRKFTVLISIILIILTPSVLAQDNQTLPEQYDLRNLNGKNYVTPVKNQSVFGTCWAHAAVSVAETSALLKGASSNIDLSEKALAWYAYNLQNSKGLDYDLREGLSNINFDESWIYEPLTQTYSSGGTL